MSVKIMSEVWESAPVSGGCLLTLLALADAANDHRVTWLGIKKLTEKSRCSRASVYRHVEELQKLGILIRLTKYELNISDKVIPEYIECAWRISHPETWKSQIETEESHGETDVSQNETITIIEPSSDPSLETLAEQRSAHKDFYKGLQEGTRKLNNEDYEPWPDQEQEKPKAKKINSRNLAIDFDQEAKVQCGSMTVTNVGALSKNIATWHKAGVPYEEISAVINYFFQNPRKYMWNDVRPWQAFVYKWLQIRKDCDWTDPNAKPRYIPQMERPKGSRILDG